jgi:hypothetical protein
VEEQQPSRGSRRLVRSADDRRLGDPAERPARVSSTLVDRGGHWLRLVDLSLKPQAIVARLRGRTPAAAGRSVKNRVPSTNFLSERKRLGLRRARVREGRAIHV